MRGKPSAFSGLRIVLFATAITIALLFFAFGTLGVLMTSRAPQEPLASKFDPAPPVVARSEPLPEQTAPMPETIDAQEEPLLIPEPAPVPFATQDEIERQEAALPAPAIETQPEPITANAPAEPDQENAESEPETTATIPAQPQKEEPEAEEQPAVVPRQRKIQRQAPPRQRVVRRAQQKKSAEPQNPLMQLFGFRQYR
ncbi:MAG TPA: hypothetical protein PL193_04175 [Xanthobacteraceae bacterium]|nr:hypothetical protein [Xanthobacteraceae bacterium]